MVKKIIKHKGEEVAQEHNDPDPLARQDEVIQLEDGTQYRTVAGRKAKFNNAYKNGSIVVELLTEASNKDYFVVKATVFPDSSKPERKFVALGQCERIAGDKFASLEKAETTAIGRALSHMSTSLIGAGASEDEIDKNKGVSAFQKSLRETLPIEKAPIPLNPKAEVNLSKLASSELPMFNEWSEILSKCSTKEELIKTGVQIKAANLQSRVTEELRKLFNKQLRALSSKENTNAIA